jgi:3-oxoacyl-[acyl-carrier protein] reductase
MQSLIGRAALVTGGSRGIGAAIARTLAQRGCDVAITYATAAAKAERVVAEIHAAGRHGLALQADSGQAEQVVDAVGRAAAEFGRLDILVNNAGVFPFGPPEQMTLEDVDRALAINVRAVFLASQAALKHMPRGGRIISIGSCFAQRVPHGGVTLYAMTKSSLIGFTKGLAHDVGPRGITVNVVDPGSTDTDMNPADQEGAEAQRALTAVGDFARPDEIAATVAFLAGDDARMITGASLAVDGGFAA